MKHFEYCLSADCPGESAHMVNKIDEKSLEKFRISEHTSGHGEKSFHIEYPSYSRQELDELIRLARLGLWAEKHGVPALSEASGSIEGHITRAIKEALAALPKTQVIDPLSSRPNEGLEGVAVEDVNVYFCEGCEQWFPDSASDHNQNCT